MVEPLDVHCLHYLFCPSTIVEGTTRIPLSFTLPFSHCGGKNLVADLPQCLCLVLSTLCNSLARLIRMVHGQGIHDGRCSHCREYRRSRKANIGFKVHRHQCLFPSLVEHLQAIAAQHNFQQAVHEFVIFTMPLQMWGSCFLQVFDRSRLVGFP